MTYVEQKLPSAAGHQLTVTDTATSLQSLIRTALSDKSYLIPDRVNTVEIQVQTEDIRVLTDGNTPTTAIGYQVGTATGLPSTYTFVVCDPSKIQFIRDGASNALVHVKLGVKKLR